MAPVHRAVAPRSLLAPLLLAWLQVAACSPGKAPASGLDAGSGGAGDSAMVKDAGTDAFAELNDIMELIDVHPVADGQDAAVDAADVPAFDFGPCPAEDVATYPDSSDEVACNGGCPPGYPCTCGVCPWMPTPPMKKPRWGARAVWTGKEVVVFGGASTNTSFSSDLLQWTAERWDPKSDKGFALIDTPPIVTLYQYQPLAPRWDGQKVWVVFRHLDKPADNDYSYTWDPLLDKSTPLQWNGRPFTHSAFSAAVWVGGRLFDWGYLPDQPGVAKAVTQNVVTLYDPASQTWAKVAFPETLVAREENDVAFACTVASGEDVFVYHAPVHVLPGSSLDPKKSIHLQYHVPTGAWSVLPQTMPVDPGYGPCGGIGFVVGTASGFAVWGQTLTTTGYTPPAGAIYDKASQTWSAMPLPGSLNAIGTTTTVLVGLRIVARSTWHGVSAAVYDLSTNTWSYTTPIGFPFEQHPRHDNALVATDQDLLQLGGSNGTNAIFTVHADGVRLPLSSLELKP